MIHPEKDHCYQPDKIIRGNKSRVGFQPQFTIPYAIDEIITSPVTSVDYNKVTQDQHYPQEIQIPVPHRKWWGWFGASNIQK